MLRASMGAGRLASWRRWGARLRVGMALAALAAFLVTGVRHTRQWVGTLHARANGPLATIDELLAPLGLPSPAATITRVIGEIPPDMAVAFVGEGPEFTPVQFAVNLLSYPRPFMAWQCIHPAAPAQPYYWWPSRPNGLVFVHRPAGLAQRHAVRWLGPRLLALRRPERFPPPERLCENVPEPHRRERGAVGGR